MTQKQISGILKQDTIQVSYNKWSEEVQSNINEVEKIFRQNPRKDITQLKRKRKKTESAISNHRKYIWEDSKNRKNKTHKGTHNR